MVFLHGYNCEYAVAANATFVLLYGLVIAVKIVAKRECMPAGYSDGLLTSTNSQAA